MKYYRKRNAIRNYSLPAMTSGIGGGAPNPYSFHFFAHFLTDQGSGEWKDVVFFSAD